MIICSKCRVLCSLLHTVGFLLPLSGLGVPLHPLVGRGCSCDLLECWWAWFVWCSLLVINGCRFAVDSSNYPPTPSSTWIPSTPARVPSFSRSTKTHGSKGHASKFNFCRSLTREQYHKYGASMRLYALLLSFPTPLGSMFRAVRISGTGSIAVILSAWACPCKKAAFMSKDWRSHP